MKSDDDAISDDELTAAAVTLATLEDGAPLPAHVRERAEASGRRILGERAREHALRRVAPSNAGSTTSAGSQVIVAVGPSPGPRSRRFPYAWGGAAAFAAAAALFVLVRSRAPLAHDAGAVAHDVQRIVVSDASGWRGELRYDRGDGTGSLTLPQPPSGVEGAAFELWIAFEGDRAPRPVALIPAPSNDVAIGDGQPLCRPLPGHGCAPVQEVFVTREAGQGTLTLVEGRIVLRGRGAQP